MVIQRVDHGSNWEDSSSIMKGHSFILVAINYFTKCVEAVPLKKVEQKEVIKFIKE